MKKGLLLTACFLGLFLAACGAEKRIEDEGSLSDHSYLSAAETGDVVSFGTYEQDNDTEDGAEPIGWYVLEKSDGEMTLLAVNILDCKPYHTDTEEVTWENSSLRSWLNEDFYNTAFDPDEKDMIAKTKVANKDNPFCDAKGGNDTTDKVYLLSLGEMETYFRIENEAFYGYWTGKPELSYSRHFYDWDNRIKAMVTDYAAANKCFVRTDYTSDESAFANGGGWWWLRTSGEGNRAECCVDNGGGIWYSGNPADTDRYGVRPVLRIKY